jgi:hypothetical protein
MDRIIANHKFKQGSHGRREGIPQAGAIGTPSEAGALLTVSY